MNEQQTILRLKMTASALRRAAYLCLMAEAFEDEFQIGQIAYRLEKRAESIAHPTGVPSTAAELFGDEK